MTTVYATDKHDAIADAVLAIAARQGLEYVSLRHVAQEAGISMGQVQYYFHTTADMLYFAVKRVLQRLEQQLGERVKAFPIGDDPLDPLLAQVHAMIDDDPELLLIMRVLGQYESRLEKDDRIGALLARNDPALQASTAAIFEHAKQQGAIAANIDPVQEAQVYWVLLGALAVEVAINASTVERGREMMTYHLNRLRTS